MNPGAAPDAASPAPSLAAARTDLVRSRLLGRISACIFLLAALAVIDALQTLVRHEFNSLNLVPGETVLLSGMLPAGKTSHTQLIFTIEGEPGISFTPVETYKGFWFGGHMWRAKLAAAADMRQGRAVLTVEDIIQPPAEAGKPVSFDDRDRAILFGGQQNPALVFAITVWPSESERRAADTSFFRRYTGFPAFGVATACFALALLAGLGNWRLFSRAEQGLARNSIFFIHGLKELQGNEGPPTGGVGAPPPVGYRAAFAHVGKPLAVGNTVLLYDRNWNAQGRGRIIEVDRIKAQALFPKDGTRPRYGWLVSLEQKAGE